MIALLVAMLVALTDSQVDHIIAMIESAMHAISAGIQALWVILGPALIGYVAWRQSRNRSAAEEDAKLTREKGAERQDAIVKEIITNREGIKGVTDKVDHGVSQVVLGNVDTAEVKEHLKELRKLAAIKTAVDAGGKANTSGEVIIPLPLPGFDYVDFMLANGCAAQWRSEPVEHGRLVRFILPEPGSCRMNFHRHPETREILTVIKGILTLELSDRIVTLHRGQSHETATGDIHAAHFQGEHGSEALCWWPDLESDDLLIGTYPQPETP